MAEVEARYNYRLRVNQREAQLLGDVVDVDRAVWNTALGRWNDLWKYEQISYSYKIANQELTDWRSRLEWMADQPVTPQQQVLRDLFQSISAFFDKKNPAGRPKFKSKKSGYATARWTTRGFKVSGAGLGVLGDRLEVATAEGRLPLRVVWSRPLPAAPTSVTIKRDKVGHWWASFVVKVEVPDTAVNPTGRHSGIDLGLNVFAATEHDETEIANPRFARSAKKAVARSQRNMARKEKGSKNYAKAKYQSAVVQEKVANQRKDHHHKKARDLANTYDRIGVEDLAIKNMMRKGTSRQKSGLNRSIADAGWGKFVSATKWQFKKKGKEVVVFNAKDTTQTCSSCGAKAKPRIELSDRVFRCWKCGLVIGRDRNSAHNLNPDRMGPGDGTKPSGVVPSDDRRR